MHGIRSAGVGREEVWRQIMFPSRPAGQNDAKIDASVEIQRPPAEIFDFYRDFRNMPRFLGDVVAVELLGSDESRWTIQGPWGVQLHWTVKVTEARENALIRYETKSPPGLRTRWEVGFTQGSHVGATRVREIMFVPFGRIGRTVLASMGKPPVEEVRANLNRLRQITETGRVTDTSYSVAGKFG